MTVAGRWMFRVSIKRDRKLYTNRGLCVVDPNNDSARAEDAVCFCVSRTNIYRITAI